MASPAVSWLPMTQPDYPYKADDGSSEVTREVADIERHNRPAPLKTCVPIKETGWQTVLLTGIPSVVFDISKPWG
jgi:hypothetical protein